MSRKTWAPTAAAIIALLAAFGLTVPSAPLDLEKPKGDLDRTKADYDTANRLKVQGTAQ